MSGSRKYLFDWDVIIGDMSAARENLGPTTRVEVYRLFQFTLRDVLEQKYGTEETDILFREAGVLAGKSLFHRFCSGAATLGELVKTLQDLFKEYGIGILRLEKSNLVDMTFTITVDEDLDCSGMQDTGDEICVYDEGLIQGILQEFTGKNFEVREVDCWCAGERTCRFDASVKA